ncbi:MAG: hypothetical protein NTX92_08780, partial [Euryarchaeota archaeon]|nr:hypothetical protein [Euryarchaeota archaeon]
ARIIDVVGRDECLKIDCLNQKVRRFHNGAFQSELPVQPNNTLRDEILHFIEAAEKGSVVSNDGVSGAKVVEALECSRDSLHKGKTVVT